MKYEEAKKIINEISKEQSDGYYAHLAYGGKEKERWYAVLDALDNAIQSLEKQIPKKFNVKEVDRFKGKFCPVCDANHGLYIPNLTRKVGIYCSKCGQRIEGVEDENRM